MLALNRSRREEHAELLQLSFEKAVLLHENHHESTL